ncbi:hypothetical protein AALA48_07705 [Bifidobacterium pseudolongum]|uniref:hypothetical protein n=1 Tax=Bifidobacterium pseudolongum TaxID=1694 RepID=UPI0035127377
MTPPPSPAPSAPPPCAVPLPPRTVPPPPGPERAGARMLLPCFPADPGRVWLVGAHGGAGCTTVYMSDRGLYADAGRALPVSMDPSRPAHVVLCARGTGRGLQALRDLLAWWHAGGMGATRLLGVAVTAPCRRTPRALRRGTDLIGSAAPALWRLPWISGLELDAFPDAWPAAYRRMREDVRGAAGRLWAAGAVHAREDDNDVHQGAHASETPDGAMTAGRGDDGKDQG